MTLYFIGLGLGEKDISYRGLKVAKKCSSIYLESYTSKLTDVKNLNLLFGKDVILADRELVEKKAEDTILQDCAKGDVAFLVMGDAFSATTHVDLMLRAKKKGINVITIHAGSIITAVGAIGLSLYNFGKITSIPFGNENIKAPVEVIKKNLSIDLHTLVLFDLNPSENKYMTIKEALSYLLKGGMSDGLCVGCAGLGTSKQQIKFGKASELVKVDFTNFPQCLVVCGKLNFVEEEALEFYK